MRYEAIGQSQLVSRSDPIDAQLLGPVSGPGDRLQPPWTCRDYRSVHCRPLLHRLSGMAFLIAGTWGSVYRFSPKKRPDRPIKFARVAGVLLIGWKWSVTIGPLNRDL